jgi:hypothetical protein
MKIPSGQSETDALKENTPEQLLQYLPKSHSFFCVSL